MKWKPTTEAKYYEMLEVLPPAYWTGLGFLVGEPWDHNRHGQPRFEAFVEIKGEYFVNEHPMTIAEFKAVKPEEILKGENA